MGAASGMSMWGQGVKTMMAFDAAKEEKRAGEMSEQEIKQQVLVEGKLAAQQEIERRRSLMRALASQNARAGAQGVALSGSIGNASRVDIRDYEEDAAVHKYNTVMRKNALLQKGRNARRAGSLKASSTKNEAIVNLLSAGGSALAGG